MADKFTEGLAKLLQGDGKMSKQKMTLNEYQELASRTANEHANEKVNYALGLTGEAGEVADIVKKEEFHGHTIDRAEKVKELGDVFWYLAQEARVNVITLDEIATANIEKLRKRYPQGFSEEASVNRND